MATIDKIVNQTEQILNKYKDLINKHLDTNKESDDKYLS